MEKDSKMASVNLAISVIINGDINGLNTQIKMAEFIRLDKKDEICLLLCVQYNMI